MGQSTNTFRDSATIGDRWAAALKRRYGSAKLVARAFDCSVRTAEAWCAGQAPYARTLLAAWRLHGAAIVAEVLAPGSDWHRQSSIDAALVEVEHKLKSLADELASLRAERRR